MDPPGLSRWRGLYHARESWGGLLVCEECGNARQVQLEDDHGREVKVDENVAALKLVAGRVVCGDNHEKLGGAPCA